MLCATAAAADSLGGVAPGLQKDAKCIYRVLRKTPGIDQIKLGVSLSGHWFHPYVEYRAAPDQTGSRFVVRFEAVRDCTPDNLGSCCSRKGEHYCFMAWLPGISAVGGPGPSDWGASAIGEAWETKCHVPSMAIFT